MTNKLILIVLLSAGLTACVSSNPNFTPKPQSELAGTILLYRTHSLQATLANAFIGTEDGYFIELNEDQYTTFQIDSGFHKFKAKAHASAASKKDIKIGAGETVCIQARPNLEDLEWQIVPIVGQFFPTFVLEETECPSNEELQKLTQV